VVLTIREHKDSKDRQLPDRMPRARLLISVAPGRPYSPAERQLIHDYVRVGGTFITTVGYDERGPSEQLLSELGFSLGGRLFRYAQGGTESQSSDHFKAGLTGDAQWEDALGQPRPLGHFKAPFFQGLDPQNKPFHAFVRFHAAWPLDCYGTRQQTISEYPGNVPLIISRRYHDDVTAGRVIVISDTCFAMNKNLENEDGSLVEGMRENADFWRYLLSLIGDGAPWYPPPPPAASGQPDPGSPPVTPDSNQEGTP
jgi:hypothetical protein